MIITSETSDDGGKRMEIKFHAYTRMRTYTPKYC